MQLRGSTPGEKVPAIIDCWNRIGVRGDRSCEELRHVHCQNCPVFSNAAKSLLDRELPPDYAADLTDHFATAKHNGEAETHSAVIFRLAAEWFALPTDALDEIAEARPIHSLPHRRNAAVLGIVNVRGELIVSVSLARMLALPETTVAPSGRAPGTGRLAVMHDPNGRFAFPVDEVRRMHRVAASDLKPVPATISRSANNYGKGVLSWDGQTVGYLDPDLIRQAVQRVIG
jgi:chemotaxis-related protein WspD